MSQQDLQAQISELAESLEVPGACAAVYFKGEEQYAFHGVTSLENPLPVDEETLFQIGSTGKTYTGTAIMRLVERGLVDLDERVITYIPELKLKDENAASEVRVLNLLNHSAGWEGDLLTNTGDGDDALARYVELMADLDQVEPLGSGVSYNNAAVSLAGRVIEKVMGMTYEQAIKDLLLEPLGMTMSFFFNNEIMTRRFVVGHDQRSDGSIIVMRPWGLARNGNPAGGLSTDVRDQIAWARFHLGDGTGPDGTRILSKDLLLQMQQPTAKTPLGDAYGISWHLRDLEGVRIVAHGGTTLGQHSSFEMAPDHNFAITVMSNCGPNGPRLNEKIVKWAFENYLGVVERDPVPAQLSSAELQSYSGRYETIAMVLDVTVDEPHLVVKAEIKPGILAKIIEEGQDPPENPPPFKLGILGDGDKWIEVEGQNKGEKGYFVRNASGEVEGLHVGRLATRTGPVPASDS